MTGGGVLPLLQVYGIATNILLCTCTCTRVHCTMYMFFVFFLLHVTLYSFLFSHFLFSRSCIWGLKTALHRRTPPRRHAATPRHTEAQQSDTCGVCMYVYYASSMYVCNLHVYNIPCLALCPFAAYSTDMYIRDMYGHVIHVHMCM